MVDEEDFGDEGLLDRLDRKQDKQRVKSKRKTEQRAAYGAVFDQYTIKNIHKLQAKGVIQDFIGIISAGKEANVFFARGENDKPLAVKIYKIDPQNTKWMKNYIIGDPRFKKIGTSTHKIIYTWCKKEYKNLTQLKRHGIIVPEVIEYRDNVLVMQFIGDENGTPARRLKDISQLQNPAKELIFILDQIRKMYLEAHLVHGDLSEFNILYYQGHQIIIDVSQAVSVYHFNAPVYLQRDLRNVIKFFGNFIPPDELPDPKDFAYEILREHDSR